MSLETFHEVRFPLALGRGASGGPGWSTEIVALSSGGEVRNARWQAARRRWDVASAVSSVSDLSLLADFFSARRGRLHGFRFHDMLDHASSGYGAGIEPTDQVLGTGDGEQVSFQLIKSYGAVSRTITKPVEGTVIVALDGVAQPDGWSVDTTTGLVTFEEPPESGVEVTAGFEFDCAVRFDTDFLDITVETIGAGRAVSVPLVEIV
ncbi:DUF2460 domain-containing protein [Henriciella pelagia]|uniref:Glycoside hydrolase family 24 n=1 Tax=Henriciella pelagia TaxID=1977912 RepID=A0ABQ1J010_9PROT|nr:DUF2460 domain-containing protein [Henriciella pelagia]GGB56805.1 glycoside hydrolase family 24 [Henriciella pelagia]